MGFFAVQVQPAARGQVPRTGSGSLSDAKPPGDERRPLLPPGCTDVVGVSGSLLPQHDGTRVGTPTKTGESSQRAGLHKEAAAQSA